MVHLEQMVHPLCQSKWRMPLQPQQGVESSCWVTMGQHAASFLHCHRCLARVWRRLLSQLWKRTTTTTQQQQQ